MDLDQQGTTKVVFGSEARESLFQGLKIAADAVSCTMGPKGKTVLIQRPGGNPIVTKDGVTVSKSVKLRDPLLRMGADLVKEAASQTNDLAGDGTTTSTVLTSALVKNGLKYLNAGYSSRELCEGIARAVREVDQQLIVNARVISSPNEISQIATISANGDVEIGKIICDAMTAVGPDGVITVEDAKGITTSLDLVEGMQVDRGYLSPMFVTHPEKMQCTYNDAYVLVTDKKISSLRDLIPTLEWLIGQQKPLLIIADDIEGEALQGLVINRVKGNLPVCAIRAPGYGTHRGELLNDIVVLTGGKLVSSNTGVSINDARNPGVLGRVAKFTVDAKSTIIVGSPSTSAATKEHVDILRGLLQDVTLTEDELVKLKMRIAKLAAGVGVIRVGGSTEVEMIEKKYRIEDALNATRAALDEGIIPGGGATLWCISQCLSSNPDDMGLEAVKEAIREPLRQIVRNAGGKPDVVEENMKLAFRQQTKSNFGYNARTDTYENLIEAGVIDPVKVTRSALRAAASVAVTFLTLDAVIIEDAKDT